jgi:Zn-finger nucleic acid-binding protein
MSDIRTCPLDGKDLIATQYEADVEVDLCQTCGGVWLDAGELQRIQDLVENDYSSALKEVPDDVAKAYALAREQYADALCCPCCNEPLEKIEYGFCSQIVIDVCSRCRGTWLQRDELKSLEIFFERSQAETEELRRGFFASLFRS